MLAWIKVTAYFIIASANFDGIERNESGTTNSFAPFTTAKRISTTNGSNVIAVAKSITSEVVIPNRRLKKRKI